MATLQDQVREALGELIRLAACLENKIEDDAHALTALQAAVAAVKKYRARSQKPPNRSEALEFRRRIAGILQRLQEGMEAGSPPPSPEELARSPQTRELLDHLFPHRPLRSEADAKRLIVAAFSQVYDREPRDEECGAFTADLAFVHEVGGPAEAATTIVADLHQRSERQIYNWVASAVPWRSPLQYAFGFELSADALSRAAARVLGASPDAGPSLLAWYRASADDVESETTGFKPEKSSS